TFLRGASHPHELVEQADSLGYAALAITDECSVAGVVRAHMAAQDRRLRLIIGSEFRLVCGLKLVALAIDRRGYGRLCRLITRGHVHMHVRARRRLQDALTAIRLRVPIAHAGLRLYANGERYLRERARLARLYPRELLEAAVELALQCSFSLDELRYEYPRELVPPGQTPASYLRRLTYEGARWRWPDGVPPGERAAIEHEL